MGKLDSGTKVFLGKHSHQMFATTIAVFGGQVPARQCRYRHKRIQVVDERSLPASLRLLCDDNHSLRGIDIEHVIGFRPRDTQTMTLANRIVMDALMPAQHFSIQVEDIPRRGKLDVMAQASLAEIRLDECGIVGVCDKADVLTFGLVGTREIPGTSELAHLSLRKLTQRKTQTLELLAGEVVENVALILIRIAGSQKLAIDQPHIMSCGQAVETSGQRPLKQLTKFEETIATDAGIGCDAGQIGTHKGLQHLPGKQLASVQFVVLDAQLLADSVGISHTLLSIIDELQADTGTLITSLNQEGSRNTAIHSPTHSYQDTLVFHDGCCFRRSSDSQILAGKAADSGKPIGTLCGEYGVEDSLLDGQGR